MKQICKTLLRNGADKIVINSILFENKKIELANNFGKQCVVASIDYKINKNKDFEVYINSGKKYWYKYSNYLKNFKTSNW